MKKEIAEQLMKDLLSLSEAMNNVVYQIDFIDEENKKRVYLRRSTWKRNASGAVYDDPRVAVGAGRVDGVGARAEA
ncbi:hypothetical protein [Methyloglobulus sp.]|uniref:hypothetical protein n=1 Tax=Methyloglobulus sp. TaxID=2518622 RepID=UPI0032B71B5C